MLSEQHATFLSHWRKTLPSLRWKEDIIALAGEAEAVALFVVDPLNAFAYEGSLASSRIRQMLPRLRHLLWQAYQHGVPHFIILADSHPDDASEFRYFPAHALRGTSEARLVPELGSLPFRDLFTLFVKNSFHPAVATSLEPWLMDNPQLSHFIVTGCGTDLGVYLLATYLQSYLLAHQREGQVIVPAECTETFDIPPDLAEELGVLPHPAELCHDFALYHLAVHGVQVVHAID